MVLTGLATSVAIVLVIGLSVISYFMLSYYNDTLILLSSPNSIIINIDTL